ncbi:MAG: hypothetical protein H6Q14_1756, partial [Bacteroidetes bacterium]|nr:hypothetical protein [Bacteroidota bacterium]
MSCGCIFALAFKENASLMDSEEEIFHM